MNPEDIQKSIQLLEKAEHVALILASAANADIFASAEVLTRALVKQGKRIGFVVNPNLDTMLHPESYNSLTHPSLLLKEFIISLDTSHTPTSQLRYERDGERIDIIISPKTHPLFSELVSFREGKTLCDCVVTLGVPDLEVFDTAISFAASLFTETPIINFDTNPANTHYGEINFVHPENPSLSEVMYDFLVAIYKEPLHTEEATLLLSGIIQETDGFKSPKTNADTLLTASELTRLGASHSDAFALAKPRISLSILQLFGRASIRSKIDVNRGIVWSFLTPEDFEKTGQTPADVPYVLSRLKNEFAAEKLCILLWQGQEEHMTSGMVVGAISALDKLQSRVGGKIIDSTLHLETQYASFREAEDQLSELLASIL